jgi:hypothetical protein
MSDTHTYMASQNHPRINIRLSPAERNKFDVLSTHGFSAREVLEIIAAKVSEYPITVVSKTNGAPIEIPRNILCQKKK